METQISVYGGSAPKKTVERIMSVIFLACGLAAAVCVVCMTIYMIIAGWPAIQKIGLFEFLFGQVWNPENSEYGILPMILSSTIATFAATIIALPIGTFVAIFLAKLAPSRLASFARTLIDILAGIPSVVYGLLGALLIVPQIFQLQTIFGLPTSGCLLAAIMILTIMILPTIISVSETALRAVPKSYEDASLALGSTRLQSIFKVTLRAAKSGIVAGMVLGVGRAIGEAMAVIMVAGNAAIMPEFLKPVRLLTASIPIEWAYSSGLHREALYGIGLVLFVFIMLINTVLRGALREEGGASDKRNRKQTINHRQEAATV